MRPTHHIPAEIIHEIFSHLYQLPLRVHEAHQFPWYLGQICSQWRAVFLSMRLLFWNEIQIEHAHAEETERDTSVTAPSFLRLYDSDSEIDTKQSEDCYVQPDASHTMAMLTFFLDITRGAPFSFTLYSEQDYYTTNIETQYVRLLLSKLSDHSMQWENVFMRLQFSEFSLLHNVKNRLPSLQCLELVLPYHLETEGSNHHPQLGDIFKNAPLLTDVKLCRLSDVAWTFDWASLITIHLLTSDDPEGIVSALRHTINLEQFTIDHMLLPLDSANVEKIGIIKLPHLEYLSIHGVSLLTVIQAPALKLLNINFWNQYGPFSLDEGDDALKARVTMDFLLRSHCEIAVFFSRGLRSPALIEILTCMPGLHRLALDDECESLIGMVKWLAGSQSSTDATLPRDLPLPRLDLLAFFRIFLFSNSSSMHTFLEALQDMVVDRNVLGDTRRLSPKELRLHTPMKKVFDRLEPLCRERGVQLNFI